MPIKKKKPWWRVFILQNEDFLFRLVLLLRISSMLENIHQQLLWLVSFLSGDSLWFMLTLPTVPLVSSFLEDVTCDATLMEVIIWSRSSKWFQRVILGLFYYDRHYSWSDFTSYLLCRKKKQLCLNILLESMCKVIQCLI